MNQVDCTCLKLQQITTSFFKIIISMLPINYTRVGSSLFYVQEKDFGTLLVSRCSSLLDSNTLSNVKFLRINHCRIYCTKPKWHNVWATFQRNKNKCDFWSKTFVNYSQKHFILSIFVLACTCSFIINFYFQSCSNVRYLLIISCKRQIITRIRAFFQKSRHLTMI